MSDETPGQGISEVSWRGNQDSLDDLSSVYMQGTTDGQSPRTNLDDDDKSKSDDVRSCV